MAFCGSAPQLSHSPAAPRRRQADFILAHGTEAVGTSVDGSGAAPCGLEGMRELLDACAARGGVPMVVANPDVVTVAGTELRWGGGGVPAALPSRLAQEGSCRGLRSSSRPLTPSSSRCPSHGSLSAAAG